MSAQDCKRLPTNAYYAIYERCTITNPDDSMPPNYQAADDNDDSGFGRAGSSSPPAGRGEGRRRSHTAVPEDSGCGQDGSTMRNADTTRSTATGAAADSSRDAVISDYDDHCVNEQSTPVPSGSDAWNDSMTPPPIGSVPSPPINWLNRTSSSTVYDDIPPIQTHGGDDLPARPRFQTGPRQRCSAPPSE